MSTGAAGAHSGISPDCPAKPDSCESSVAATTAGTRRGRSMTPQQQFCQVDRYLPGRVAEPQAPPVRLPGPGQEPSKRSPGPCSRSGTMAWNGRCSMPDATPPVDLVSLAAGGTIPERGDGWTPSPAGEPGPAGRRPPAQRNGQSDRGRRRAARLPVGPPPPTGGTAGGWATTRNPEAQGQAISEGSGLPIPPAGGWPRRPVVHDPRSSIPAAADTRLARFADLHRKCRRCDLAASAPARGCARRG